MKQDGAGAVPVSLILSVSAYVGGESHHTKNRGVGYAQKPKNYMFRLESCADLMFGRMVMDEKRGDETHEQREKRIWKQKINQRAGQCCIPQFALKNALTDAG